jgi:hypothetical protein
MRVPLLALSCSAWRNLAGKEGLPWLECTAEFVRPYAGDTPENFSEMARARIADLQRDVDDAT